MYEKAKLENGCNIRLLELEPGTADDPVRCRLQPVSLESCPSYECISYVWEGLPGNATIFCEGQPVEIKANLYAALKAFRDVAKARTLWADALCINQKDKPEKARQIPLMPQIYGRARQVLLWLGPSQRLTEEAFDKLKLLAMLWEQRAGRIDRRPSPEEYKHLVIHHRCHLDDASVFNINQTPSWASADICTPKDIINRRDSLPRRWGQKGSQTFEFDNASIWEAVEGLFFNVFFSRAWIMQEVALASLALVYCGGFSLSWEIFHSAFNGWELLLFHLSRQHDAMDGIAAGICTVGEARESFRVSEMGKDLSTAVARFAFSKATDHRDYIYAALGMITTHHGIIPDYEKDVEEVFLDAAKRMISQRQDLYLWGRNCSPRRKRYKALPTWVPDWSVQNDHYAFLHMTRESVTDVPGHCTTVGRRLRVNVHLLDTVCFVTKVNLDGTVLGGAAENILSIFTRLGLDLFGVYRTDYFGEGQTPNSWRHLSEPQSVQLSRLGDVFSILTKLNRVPSCVLKTLSEFLVLGERPGDHQRLNIEALWDALCHSSFQFNRGRNPGLQLFLSWWFAAACSACGSFTIDGIIKAPKAYDIWVVAAMQLTASEESCRKSFESIIAGIMSSIQGGKDLFVTNSGYIGRCSPGAAKPGHHVAILGGAYRPYLLEKQTSGLFQFVSYAYVEGMMGGNITLPPRAKVSMIEIE
ncbi:hypothetical protein Z517_03676 [Fonsecaea pedrosoi CBS 271.37]|uniref:Heterokaryon incompatibility domain-containing protein n=1 Tax=Fonsecaea pedrosoi CBS 271.37 TaxID=1442368 RepID=A0A0D2E315_9EURO|nr:uncharacterized protein Z517_03676 [Fonsecaea pedrosoi CBS 271.37]KIW84426.1 hypothetical protein Z517_03676 [Fonsecaea pedrosoi CBS 271.37]